MNPNIKEIGNVVKQMQVVSGAMRSANSPKYNQAAADIVKQGIEQTRQEKKWSTPFKDDHKPIN